MAIGSPGELIPRVESVHLWPWKVLQGNEMLTLWCFMKTYIDGSQREESWALHLDQVMGQRGCLVQMNIYLSHLMFAAYLNQINNCFSELLEWRSTLG